MDFKKILDQIHVLGVGFFLLVHLNVQHGLPDFVKRIHEVSATYNESCGPSLKGKSFEHRAVFHFTFTAHFELNKGVHKSSFHSLSPPQSCF